MAISLQVNYTNQETAAPREASANFCGLVLSVQHSGSLWLLISVFKNGATAISSK
jgi:hypothetical protein